MSFVHLPHKRAAEQHAIKRLFQRRGIIITAAEYRQLTAMCADGRAPTLAPAWGGGTIHRLQHRGEALFAVYKSELEAIVTFLPVAPMELRSAP